MFLEIIIILELGYIIVTTIVISVNFFELKSGLLFLRVVVKGFECQC